MKKTYQYRITRPDGQAESVNTSGQATLEQLQAWVGGYIERARIETPRPGWVMVNEEGLLKDLPRNITFPQFVGPVVENLTGRF